MIDLAKRFIIYKVYASMNSVRPAVHRLLCDRDNFLDDNDNRKLTNTALPNWPKES